MASCSNCAASVPEGANSCPVCGQAEGFTAQPQQHYQQPQQQYQQPRPQNPAADIEANKGMAILSYIIFFIPLIVGTHKTSPYIMFHVNQGTVLFIFSVAWGIVCSILSAILWFLFFITWLLWLVPFIMVIIGIINSAGGKCKQLPVIGKFTIIK